MNASRRTIKIGVFPPTLINSRLSACYRIFHLISGILNFSAEITVSNLSGEILPNGTWTGIFGLLNRSEIDFAPIDFFMTEQRREAVHFSYPFQIDDETFVTSKPKYSSKVFALFNTMSPHVWISIGVTTLIIVVLCFFMMKRKYPLSKIILHSVAVLLKQPGIVNPSTSSESVLLLTWMMGAMLLSLCYNSVLLLFLTFPPESGVRNVAELAAAVSNGDYNCIVHAGSAMPSLYRNTNEKNLITLADNIYKYPGGRGTIDDFLNLKGEQVAFLSDKLSINFLKDLYFISEDASLQTLRAMVMSKDFCCKNEWERYVHKLMASGIYQKIFLDEDFRMFLKKVPVKFKVTETIRPLNLEDLGAAFIFLLAGYFASVLMLVVETQSHCGNKHSYSKKPRKKKTQKKSRKKYRNVRYTNCNDVAKISDKHCFILKRNKCNCTVFDTSLEGEEGICLFYN